jgi:hypothetical protein
MRLLDLIAQGRSDLIRAPDGRVLPGAEQFKDAIRTCPVRYVLADDLAQSATRLAYADGDRLVSCLDLVHVPARSLWVEWTEAPRRAELMGITALALRNGPCVHRAGAFLSTSHDCRSGEIRTFWSTSAELAYVSPVVCEFDLDQPFESDPLADPILGSGLATVSAPPELCLDDFLKHIRFGFDMRWSAYYEDTCRTVEMRRAVLRSSLGACAFDPPMLFAFFLMLAARDALPRRAVPMDRLNRARQRAGKAPLLDHIEVSAPLCPESASTVEPSTSVHERRFPRLHHVCGHIVRRGTSIFWRSPHLRGSARLGQVKTRTVELSFAAAAPVHAFARGPRALGSCNGLSVRLEGVRGEANYASK